MPEHGERGAAPRDISPDNPAGTDWLHADHPQDLLTQRYKVRLVNEHGCDNWRDWLLDIDRTSGLAVGDHLGWIAECLVAGSRNNIPLDPFLSEVVVPLLHLNASLFAQNRAVFEMAIRNGTLRQMYDAGFSGIAEYLCKNMQSTADPIYLEVWSWLAETADEACLAWLDETVYRALPDGSGETSSEYYTEALISRYGIAPDEARDLTINGRLWYGTIKTSLSALIGDDEQGSLFDDEGRVSHRRQMRKDFTGYYHPEYFAAVPAIGLAVRECLYGREPVTAAIHRFNLPMLGMMHPLAARRMIGLASDDKTETAAFRLAAAEGRLAYALMSTPSGDHNGGLIDALSHDCEAIGAMYTLYHGVNAERGVDAATALLAADYAAAGQTLIIGHHGQPGVLLAEHDGPRGRARRISVVQTRDSGPSPPYTIQQYLGSAVDQLLEPGGDIIAFSCNSATPAVGQGERSSNIRVMARELGRCTVGFASIGRYIPTGQGELVPYRLDVLAPGGLRAEKAVVAYPELAELARLPSYVPRAAYSHTKIQ